MCRTSINDKYIRQCYQKIRYRNCASLLRSRRTDGQQHFYWEKSDAFIISPINYINSPRAGAEPAVLYRVRNWLYFEAPSPAVIEKAFPILHFLGPIDSPVQTVDVPRVRRFPDQPNCPQTTEVVSCTFQVSPLCLLRPPGLLHLLMMCCKYCSFL